MSYENSYLDIGRVSSVLERLRSATGVVIQVLSLLAGLIAWELYASTRPGYLFPNLGSIYAAFLEQMREYALLSALGHSLITLAVGFLLAAIVGVSVGIAMGLNEYLEALLNPYINALYVAPIAALIPVLILVGGPSFETRVFIVFLFAVFEIAIDAYEGVKTTPDDVLEVARSFGADRWFIVRNVIIPHDLPYIVAGLRLGIGRALKGMIIGELLIEFSNLGAIIRLWENDFRIAGVLSVVVLVMIVGAVLINGVKLLGARLIPWRTEVDA